MNRLNEIIDRITEFGTNPNVTSENKELEITKLLVDLYSEYLGLSDIELDDKDYDDEPSFPYKKIRANVVANFPSFGWYHEVWESHKIIPDADLVTGDAIDDLTDIIIDMLAVKWRIVNTSINDALWHFSFSMKIHSEQHLVNFLKYLKDKKG
ncbi:DUF5063 domain-containing protein [Flavobacteriaceae bacterium S0825]|uniref:DUF5063 domain-containing protein n=1 Tax=Gaetbulibacter sp. S0825 TaxID=2720084 RepID=UPI001430B9A4|nr:DUF5063 domain-containing protein [Gaetbulibacter sp. S0825]MCK0108004.1 DUF5063 domain-containing protein [Flavobacteriaceae bacterium S0825]NIX63640.1 DUF5063 domain-containing protein [Gaetbulibacter sp. S0825]